MSQSDFVQRGAALVSQGDYQEAVKTCRLGLLSRPSAAGGRIVLGQALLALGRYDEVLAEMKVALEAAPSDGEAYALRGEALLRKGDYQLAKAALRLAEGLSPRNPHVAALLEEAETVTSQVEVNDPTSLFAPIEVRDESEVRDETETRHYQRSAPRPPKAAASASAQPVRLASATETESARAAPHEDTLLVPLSPPPGPGDASGNGWSSAVAKKNITEPLGDDALVEVPPPLPRSGRPSHPQEAARPAPRMSRPGVPAAANPPPLPGAPPRSGPLPGAPRGAAGLPPPLPGAPPRAVAPAAPPNAATMAPAPAPWAASALDDEPAPPPPPRPLPPQQAGVFAAYQTHVAAQPPAPPPSPGAAPVPPRPVVATSLPPPGRSTASQAARAARPRRKARSGLATALWVLVGAAVIGGGVLAGFQIRDLRLRRQIEAAERRGQEASASDGWLGWRVARDGLASISAARKTLESRAALARAQALVAYEFGDGAGEAAATLRGIGADPRAAVARVYMALIAGDLQAAARELDVAAAEGGATVEYLRGRIALAGADPKAAVAALEKAHRVEPRPFFTIALAEAHAAMGRWDVADKLLTGAAAKAPDHPALALASARLAIGAGALDERAVAGALAALDRVIAEGEKPLTGQGRGVSPWQLANALVLRARVLLARGDRAGALSALAKGLEVGVDEQRFAEASVAALLAADQVDVAASAAKRGLTAWPHSVPLRVEAARALQSSGRLSEAIEALPDVLIGKDPAALAARATARLWLGDVDGAQRDLDVVQLASSPELAMARTLLAVARGDKVDVRAGSARVDDILLEARVARLRGDAARAASLLRPVLERPLGASRFAVRLELARAYRDSADYRGARAAYNELMSTPNPQLRLETAQLLLDDRDPKNAREHIEALMRDQGDKASGLVLIEAMRIRTLTGAGAAAESLAQRAAQAGAPAWMLQREAARIARRRDDLAAAAAALDKALDGSKDDLDTILMACDVVDAASPDLVQKLTKAVDERLVDKPDLLVAQGKLALARGDTAKATELFDKAAQRFKERPASARRLAQVSFGAGALAVGRSEWVMARRKLEAAIELDPSLLDAYTYLAVALQRMGELPQAVALLRTASELAPDSPLVWQTLADYAAAGRDAKTAAEAQKRLAALARGTKK